MERCPICRARFKDELVCHRCGADLTVLFGIETQATALERQAVGLLGAGDLIEARHVAGQVLQLKHSPLARAVLGFATQELVKMQSQVFERLLR
jgi:hypothetical protein